MRQSIGKDVARDILYREYLPQFLTPVQIRSAAVLLLLGDEPREIPYLDELLVAHDRVHSVENQLSVYHQQQMWDLGVYLHYAEMSEFLRVHLHDENRFAFMNLDIEGTFRYNLDPSLESVLRYCLKYPQTAIATYTTIGHDEYMLFEGVYSLALLWWLSPHETEECIATLERRYVDAEYENAYGMALRDLFWIRSHLEHAAIASYEAGGTSRDSLSGFFGMAHGLWRHITSCVKLPLRFEQLIRLILDFFSDVDSEMHAFSSQLPKIALRVVDVRHLVYRGDNTWSHRCYMVKFEDISHAPLPMSAWLAELLTRFTETPLTAINQKGVRRDLVEREDTWYRKGLVWRKKTLLTKFKPRRIWYPDTVLAQGDGQGEALGTDLVFKGVLTPFGVEMVRRFAAEGWTTAQIRTFVPAEIPDSVLRSYISAAHRKHE